MNLKTVRGRCTAVAAVCALALLSSGCSHSSTGSGAATTQTSAPRGAVLVTMGSNATLGSGRPVDLTRTWAQRFYIGAFPVSTVFVNASDQGATVDEAIAQQLPLALQVHATVVAVWLGDTDLAANVPAPIFERSVDILVKRLRESGARVLVGNIGRTRAGAAAYDDAIARVAHARGATVVDLGAALSATPNASPSSVLDTSESRIVAAAFAAALATS